MKRQRLSKCILSFILSVVLLIGAFPVSAISKDENVKTKLPKIVSEVTHLREESVKHFLCEDGTYIAATYANPVHYKENGEWKEINNNLVLSDKSVKATGKLSFTPKASKLSVSIPQSFSDGQQVMFSNKGYTVKFAVSSDSKTANLAKTAVVKPDAPKAQKSKAISEKIDNNVELFNEEKMAVNNQVSTVVYEDIFSSTDLEYKITSDSIKENIIIEKPQQKYSYLFNIDLGGLVPLEQEDGSIFLVEKSNPEKIVFLLQAPYMYDSLGAESYDIKMSLIPDGEKYLLTLNANSEWLNRSERQFPVVIDPTIYFMDSDFEDVFVIDGVYANSPRILNELRVGRNLTNNTRTYIKMILPQNIPIGSVVSDAKLILKKRNYFKALGQSDIFVRVYDCKNVSVWNPLSITWNNQPFNNSNYGYISANEIALSEVYTSSSREIYSFDITDAVQNWFKTGVNNGLMLASSHEDVKTQIDFYSSRFDNADKRPDMWFNYSKPTISQNTWNAEANASTSPEINVVASQNWSATANQPWLSISNITGTSFKINASENSSVSERTGTVTVTMDNDTIGTVNVTQIGTNPSLILDTEKLVLYNDGGSKVVWIASNADCDAVPSADWISVSKANLNSDGYFTISVNAFENTEPTESDVGNDQSRTGIVTVKTISGAMDVTKTIEIIQLDEISSYFNEINPHNASMVAKDSSDYNHPLATWGMKLSYMAYNPTDCEALPGVPSLFMLYPFNNPDYNAKFELGQNGFKDIAEFNNTEPNNVAAHTIGHREIAFGSNSNSGYTTRPLVVIVIRGSISSDDWCMDIASQINLGGNDFSDGRDMVLNSLLHGTGDTANCANCNGCGCITCKGYIEGTGINDPIIFITGHSLGAAIANLTAAYLNPCNDSNHLSNSLDCTESDVFAYTFATPTTIDVPTGASVYDCDNIFNILNNNDLVPLLPISLGCSSNRVRYGRDFHITMPMDVSLPLFRRFDTALIGFGGHAMPTYMSWMNSLSENLNTIAREIEINDINNQSVDNVAYGLLPRILRVKCPVEVTLYDDANNIIAYESQNPNAVYPEITDSNIISWINDDGAKMFFIPYGGESVTTQIKAYNYGTMNLTVEVPGLGEPIESTSFENVNLYPNKEFEIELSDEVAIEDTQLLIVENGEVVGEVINSTDLEDAYLKSASVVEPVVLHGTDIFFTFVTDRSVWRVRFIEGGPNGVTSTYTMDHPSVSVVDNGETLTWTIKRRLPCASFVFDIGVAVGSAWYVYDRVLAITVLY